VIPKEIDYDEVNDLGVTLTDSAATINWSPAPIPGEAAVKGSDLVPAYLPRPRSTIPRAIELVDTAPTDLQVLNGAIAVRLRSGVRDMRGLVKVGLLFARFVARIRHPLAAVQAA
jgi:hypothetical protein